MGSKWLLCLTSTKLLLSCFELSSVELRWALTIILLIKSFFVKGCVQFSCFPKIPKGVHFHILSKKLGQEFFGKISHSHIHSFFRSVTFYFDNFSLF